MTKVFTCPEWPSCGCPDGTVRDDCPGETVEVGSNEHSMPHEGKAVLDAYVAELQSENDRLRAALANSDQPCAYCSLPADEWTKCKVGFPGCGRADDAMGCPELGAAMLAADLEKQVAALREALASTQGPFPVDDIHSIEAAINAAISDTAEAASSYEARIRAEERTALIRHFEKEASNAKQWAEETANANASVKLLMKAEKAATVAAAIRAMGDAHD